jgi:tetratricopeptide (TPR) repeat protein
MRAALLSILCPLVIFATGAYGASDLRLAAAVESFNKGMHREALESAREYLKSVPNSRLALEIAAKSSGHLHRYAEGADYAKRLYAVDKRPKNLYIQASYLFEGKKFQESLKILNQIILFHPNFGPAYVSKAEIVRLRIGVGSEYAQLISKAENCPLDVPGFKEDLEDAKAYLKQRK